MNSFVFGALNQMTKTPEEKKRHSNLVRHLGKQQYLPLTPVSLVLSSCVRHHLRHTLTRMDTCYIYLY